MVKITDEMVLRGALEGIRLGLEADEEPCSQDDVEREWADTSDDDRAAVLEFMRGVLVVALGDEAA